MDAARYEVVSELFGRALNVPPEDRASYVRTHATDDAVRSLTLELLAAHAEDAVAPGFLEADRPFATPRGIAEGQIIGPYRILREIGRGGMGTVYLAERQDPAFSQKVAIKVLNRGLDTDSLLRRFEAERRTLARLQHPNIVRLFDGGATDDGRPYFAMELVEGAPHIEYAAAHGLSIEDRITLMAEICDAVEYAHRNLVLHRDLKPANILVAENGRPRLLDFGIAQALDRDPTEGFTRTAERRLTPQYASPEQMLGKPLSTASDVYSLGVLLCEILTGRRPIEVLPDDGLAALLDAEPRAPSTLVADTTARKRLRGDLDTIVLKALQKEPSRRYAGADALANDLRRHLQGHPVSARADTLRYRLSRFTRRHRVAVAASTVGLLVSAGGVAATLYQARIAHAESERAVRRFAETRKLAKALLGEIHDSVMNLPGSIEARSLIVKRSLEYLDGLRSDPGSDAALTREVAQAYVRVGDVQGLPRYANLGDRTGARSSYQKALALREGIRAAFANDAAFQIEGFQLEQRIGEVEDALGDLKAASARFRKAVGDGRALLARPGAPPTALREVATAEALLGDTLGSSLRPNLGDPEAALEHYRAAVDLVDRWLRLEPASGERRHFSANFRARLGRTLASLGRVTEAIPELEAAIAILNAAQKEFPNVTPIRRDLASHRRLLAAVLVEAGRPAEALPLLDLAGETARVLREENPKNVLEPQLAANVAITRSKALLMTGRPAAAQTSAGEAAQHAQDLGRLVPGDRSAAVLEARAWIAEAESEAALERRTAAGRRAVMARDLAEKLVTARPEDMSARVVLATSLALLSRLGPANEAAASRDRAVSLLRDAERKGRLDLETRAVLASLVGDSPRR